MSSDLMVNKEVGEVFTYFSNAGVAAINLSGNLKVGDKVHVKGHTTDFEQEVNSMQIDSKEVSKGKKGDKVGIKVEEKVRPKDKIFLE